MRRYRDWFEKRLERYEDVLFKVFIAYLVVLPLTVLPTILNIPMLLKIFVIIYIGLIICTLSLFTLCIILENILRSCMKLLVIQKCLGKLIQDY